MRTIGLLGEMSWESTAIFKVADAIQAAVSIPLVHLGDATAWSPTDSPSNPPWTRP